jgi:hypothetical protein
VSVPRIVYAPASSGAVTDDVTGRRTYPYPPTGEQLWSVTTALDGTHGQPYLVPWAARIAAEYAITNLDALARIKVCKSPEDAIAVAAAEAKRIRERKADVGTYVHKMAEALIYWALATGAQGATVTLPELPDHLDGTLYDEEPVEEVAERMVAGFCSFIAGWQPEILAAEMTVYNPGYKYAGTLDSLMRLHGYGLVPSGRRFCAGAGLDGVIDIKTGRIRDYWDEQLAGYMHCTAYGLKLGQVAALQPADFGAILHLRPEYPDGYKVMLVARDRAADAWNRFRRAIELFRGREENGFRAKPGCVVRPLLPDGSMPPVLIEDLDELYPRAPKALHAAGLRTLDELAAMTAAQVLDVKGIGDKTLPVIRQMLADEDLSLSGEGNVTPIEKAA